MKKLALTLAIVLGITLGASAQNGGLFQKGPDAGEANNFYDRTTSGLMLPSNHGESGDQNGAPIGSGALLLIGFGAAYALKKRNEK